MVQSDTSTKLNGVVPHMYFIKSSVLGPFLCKVRSANKKGSQTLLTHIFLLNLSLKSDETSQNVIKSRESTNTRLFLRREVVDDVEKLANLLRGLAFDHVCHSFATDIAVDDWYIRLRCKTGMKTRKDIQKRFDIEVVCGKNDLEKHLLINSDELLVPFIDVSRALAGLILVGIRVCGRKRLATMVFAVFENLSWKRR